MFLESRTSAFDTPAQQQLQTAIDAAFAAEQQAAGGTLRLERSGVAVIALASERLIRADITRISTLSTLGVVALFLLLFGSLRALALGLLTLGAGCLTALAGSLLIFGEVHGITLAFGGSLIGVCIDYAVHLLNHHALDPEGAEGALERVWPGLLLGALTTVAGFTGLMVTPSPECARSLRSA